MTKIYLVKVEYLDDNESFHTVNFAAFTNYKKAKIFCEYKKLQLKQGNSVYKNRKSVGWYIETMPIWTSDWSKELNRLQIKDLPY